MESKSNWKRKLLRICSYILVAALASALTLAIFVPVQVNKRSGKLAELKALITSSFIGDVEEKQLEDYAAAAMVAATGDQWSYYIPADQLQSVLDNSANSYVGVGITVRLLEDESGYKIQRVEPNSPAQGADLRPGDIVIGVEDKSIGEIGAEAMLNMVSGKEDTAVTITVLRGSETLKKTMNRKKILAQVASGKMLTDNVGYIKINNFNDRCAEETIALFKELESKGAKAMVFDVRFNPGGYVHELVELLDYLLPEGVLFQSEDYKGNVQTEKSDPSCKNIPMAVLMNGQSYSAAEFFAAALTEYDYAVTVGQPTTGKGRFQQLLMLSDGSAVNLSVGKYVTPKGVDLSAQGGLKPDTLVDVDQETMDKIYGESLTVEEDAQLQAALAAVLEKLK